MEQRFLFSQCLEFRAAGWQNLPRSKKRGLAVGLSWTAYLEVSEATLQVIFKCAYQWLAWKHVGPENKVLLQQLLSSWCALLSLPRLHAGHEAAQAVPDSGLPAQLQGWRDRTREGLCGPSASCFPGLSSSPWPVFSLLERNLLSAYPLSIAFGWHWVKGSKPCHPETAGTISYPAYVLIWSCLEKSGLKRLNEENLGIAFHQIIVQWNKENINLVPPVAVLCWSLWLSCFKNHKSLKEKQSALIVSEAKSCKF